MKKIISLFALLIISHAVLAQGISEWKAYTSFRSVLAIAEDKDGRLWTVTDGGVAIYEDISLVKSLTTIDGLSRLDGTTIAYDEERDRIFVGYVTGRIDVIDAVSFEVRTLTDIERNVSFSAKAITKILVIQNSLLVATNFGIVDFDIQTLFVRDNYTRLGSFAEAIPIYDLFVSDNQLYAGTEEGIAFSTVNGNYSTGEWSNFDQSNGYVSEATVALGRFEDTLYASTRNANYLFDGANWNTNTRFTNNLILDYEIQNQSFIALALKNIYIKSSDADFEVRFLSSYFSTSLARLLNSDSKFVFGTLNNGLGIVSSSNLRISNSIPEGPFQNFFDGLNFDGNILIAASTQKSSPDGNINKGKGYYIFENNRWQNFNEFTNSIIDDADFRQTLRSTITEDYYYFGAWGRGVARHTKETGEVVIFDETNSILRGWPQDNPNFPVISGLETDSFGDVWAISRFGGTPLYRQTPGDTNWQAFDEDDAISPSDLYEGLFIDSFDQKWIPLQNQQASGRGLLVLRTNNPSDDTDDDGVKLEFGSGNGNLPNNKVQAIAEDLNGEVWIGTERGIARFIFPELIIDGGAQERDAQWLINEDTSAVSRFLLRDVNASAIAVNAANEKWIGSANQGIWVLNPEGSRIIKRFTKENSPLFSDNIKSIKVNDLTGEVFIATDLGLIGYQDVPKQAVREMDKLKVFPNPFNYSKNSEILIEGLSNKANIKILGVDGTVVNTFETNGGRASWNGKDFNGRELGTGIYYVIAVDAEGSSKGVGKVVIVK